MRAIVYEEFNGPIVVRDVPRPSPAPGEVVLKVGATGMCRSDWHGWRGHDADIKDLPHVPGHEMAGEVFEVGGGVSNWRVGDRVVAPFVAGCGSCEMCDQGDPQVCPNQRQPGFTHWGSFAEFVTVAYADNNLVELPSSFSYATGASLGCRVTTAYRAIVDRAKVSSGEWVAVHGCGGVGLSVVMIAASMGARVVAIDVNSRALELARELGAEKVVRGSNDVVENVVTATGGGAHVSVDAVGNPQVLADSIGSLRRRGRHVQVGLLTGAESLSPVPMGRVVAWELDLLGSHGASPSVFRELFGMIEDGRLDPGLLVTRRLDLEQGAALLSNFESRTESGIAVIDVFE